MTFCLELFFRDFLLENFSIPRWHLAAFFWTEHFRKRKCLRQIIMHSILSAWCTACVPSIVGVQLLGYIDHLWSLRFEGGVAVYLSISPGWHGVRLCHNKRVCVAAGEASNIARRFWPCILVSENTGRALLGILLGVGRECYVFYSSEQSVDFVVRCSRQFHSLYFCR